MDWRSHRVHGRRSQRQSNRLPTSHRKSLIRGQITGRFTKESAEDLALTLRSRHCRRRSSTSKSAPLDPAWRRIRFALELELRSSVSRSCSFHALLLPRFGINAVVALVLNMILMLAGLIVFGATLTLPGIAGIILTIGMAVDSNVLVFERIREELRSGKTVPSLLTRDSSARLLRLSTRTSRRLSRRYFCSCLARVRFADLQ